MTTIKVTGDDVSYTSIMVKQMNFLEVIQKFQNKVNRNIADKRILLLLETFDYGN